MIFFYGISNYMVPYIYIYIYNKRMSLQDIAIWLYILPATCLHDTQLIFYLQLKRKWNSYLYVSVDSVFQSEIL